MPKFFNSLKKGFIKGWNIQPLPLKLYNVYNHIFFRIFRVLGGISAVLVLSKNYLLLPFIFQYLVLALGLFQFIQMTIFFVLKSFYLIKKLIYNPEEFEVRNSPLDKYATLFAKLLSCWKSACTVGGSGTSFIGTGVLIDSVLDSAGQEKLFEPYFKKAINVFLPDQRDQHKVNWAYIQAKLKEANEKGKEVLFIQEEILAKYDVDSLVNSGLTKTEATELKTGLTELATASNQEKSELVAQAMIKVEEWKNKK